MSRESDVAGKGPTDADLVAAVRGGDVESFETLIRRYERQAAAVSYRLLGNRSDSEDVLQNAYLKAYQALDSLQDPDRFGPWLLRIVSNLSLNYRRQRASRSTLSLTATDTEKSDPASQMADGSALLPDQVLISDELKDAITFAMETLPQKQQLALTLFSIQGMPQKEVAEVMRCSVEAVKWHVFTARKALREKLKGFF